MSQKCIFFHEFTILWSAKKWCRHFFPTLHPHSPVILATATVLAFVLLRLSRFSLCCYTQHEAMPTQKSARQWCCNLSQTSFTNTEPPNRNSTKNMFTARFLSIDGLGLVCSNSKPLSESCTEHRYNHSHCKKQHLFFFFLLFLFF